MNQKSQLMVEDRRTKTKMTVSMMTSVLKVCLDLMLHVRALLKITVKMTECNHVARFLVISANQQRKSQKNQKSQNNQKTQKIQKTQKTQKIQKSHQ